MMSSLSESDLLMRAGRGDAAAQGGSFSPRRHPPMPFMGSWSYRIVGKIALNLSRKRLSPELNRTTHRGKCRV
jgi:hypothetical protein